jgi:hypothetical protein
MQASHEVFKQQMTQKLSLGPIQKSFKNEFKKKMLPLQNPSRSVMNF